MVESLWDYSRLVTFAILPVFLHISTLKGDTGINFGGEAAQNDPCIFLSRIYGKLSFGLLADCAAGLVGVEGIGLPAGS